MRVTKKRLSTCAMLRLTTPKLSVVVGVMLGSVAVGHSEAKVPPPKLFT